MENDKSLIKNLDLFGLKYQFLINGEEIYKTRTGGFLTLTYFFLSICLFFGFGIDFYQRTNPKVIFNSSVGVYENAYLSNYNFTLAYRIEDANGMMINNPSLIDPQLNYFYFKLNDKGAWDTIFYNGVNNTRCKDLPYTEEKEAYYNTSLSDWYCIDFDKYNIMGGNWDGKFVYGLQINAKQCTNTTENNNCLPQEEISNTFGSDPKTSSNIFFSYLYMQASPTMTSYYSPLSSTLINHYEMLNLKVTKRNIQTFKSVNVEDDNGWLFPNKATSYIFAEDSTASDFTFKDPIEQNILFSYIMYIGKKTDLYTRNYVKVQEVFATIGGFTSFFYKVIFIAYYAIGATYKNLNLINSLSFENEYENKGGFELIGIDNNIPSSNNTQNKVLKSSQMGSQRKRIQSTVSLHTNKNHILNKNKMLISSCLNIKYLLCGSRCKKSKDRNTLMLYNRYVKYIKHVFDALSYVRLYTEYQYLKSIVLNKTQSESLRFLPIPPKKKAKENEEIIYARTCEYYENLVNNNNLCGYDKKIFDLMTEESQNTIRETI